MHLPFGEKPVSRKLVLVLVVLALALSMSCGSAETGPVSTVKATELARETSVPTSKPSATALASARPTRPVGVTVPRGCSFVGPPKNDGQVSEWWVDCGSEGNQNARATFAAVLEPDGWLRCHYATASARWTLGDLQTSVAETAGPADLIRLTQKPRSYVDCP